MKLTLSQAVVLFAFLILAGAVTANSQVIPALDDIARKVQACSNIPNAVDPGTTLGVELALPPELLGTGQCGPGLRTFITGVPRGSYVRNGQRGRVPVPTSAPRVPARPLPHHDGLCGLLPVCPPPINVGGVTLDITGSKADWAVYNSVNGRLGSQLTEMRDFRAPTKDLNATFILAPLHFADLTTEKPTTKLFFIVATITIQAKIAGSGMPVTSSPIPIQIPVSLSALQVPKVFILFMGRDFKDAAAIYLPGNSALNQNTLKDQIGRIDDTYGQLRDKLSFVGWFGDYLAGLDALKSAFDLPHVSVKELKNFENNLNEDDFEHGTLNDIEVEDQSSSLLLLGIPGTRVKFFRDRKYLGPTFTVKTGNTLTGLISDFTNMPAPPAGGVEANTFKGKAANDSLSSFKWLPN